MTKPLPDEFTVPSRGISQYRDEVRGIAVGEAIMALPEPDNPVDGDAVVFVRAGNRPIGYLSKDMTDRYAASRKRGTALVGKVTEVYGDPADEGGVRITFDRWVTVGEKSQVYDRVQQADETIAARRNAPATGAQPAAADADVEAAPGVPADVPAGVGRLASTPPPDDVAEAEVVAADGTRTVRSTSGRVLGELVEFTAAIVRVKVDEGNIAAFPRALVDDTSLSA